MTVNHDVAGSSPAGGANKKQTAFAVCFLLVFLYGEEPRLICEANSVKVCGAKSEQLREMFRKTMVLKSSREGDN